MGDKSDRENGCLPEARRGLGLYMGDLLWCFGGKGVHRECIGYHPQYSCTAVQLRRYRPAFVNRFAYLRSFLKCISRWKELMNKRCRKTCECFRRNRSLTYWHLEYITLKWVCTLCSCVKSIGGTLRRTFRKVYTLDVNKLFIYFFSWETC